MSNRTKKYCTFTYVATGLKHRSFEVSHVWSSLGTFSRKKSRRIPSIFGDSLVCPSPEVRWLSLNFYLRTDETWMKVLTITSTIEPAEVAAKKRLSATDVLLLKSEGQTIKNLATKEKQDLTEGRPDHRTPVTSQGCQVVSRTFFLGDRVERGDDDGWMKAR